MRKELGKFYCREFLVAVGAGKEVLATQLYEIGNIGWYIVFLDAIIHLGE